MAALQQVLQELGDLVPVVPARVSELLEAGEELDERLDAVEERVRALHPRCTAAAETLAATLRESTDQAEEDTRLWQERLGSYRQARDAVKDACHDAQERLDEAGTHAAEEMARLLALVRESGVTDEHRYRTASQRHGDVAEGLQRGLGARLAALRRRQQDVMAALAVAHESVMDACDRLGSRIEEHAQAGADALARLETRARDAAEGLAGVLEGVGADVDARGRQMVDTLRAQVARPVEDALAVAVPELAGLAQEAGGLAQALAAARRETDEALSHVVGGVLSLLHPVEAALGAVRGAASLVGLGD